MKAIGVRLFSLVLFLIISTQVQGQFTCTTNEGAITISKYTGSQSDVIIPGTINGWPVVRIGNGAFYHNLKLNNVIIPDSVTNIDDDAFGYSAVTSVVMPNSLTKIGNRAFCECNSLTNATLPDSVVSIGEEAFSFCVGLRNITIPSSVKEIGNDAFVGCFAAEALTVASANTKYSSLDGVLYDLTHSVLIQFPPGKAGDCVIPNGVGRIRDYAFYDCTKLTGVTIPNSVTDIGSNAFVDCWCMPGITIPNSVTNIGSNAFEECTNLTSVTIPESVRSIGSRAFDSCCNLTNINISSEVTEIGDSVFSFCYKLESIQVDAANQTYATEDGVLFDKDKATLIACPAAKLGDYRIPRTVRFIANEAFIASSLETVTVPAAVVHIGLSAFSHSNLKAVYFEGNAPIFEWTVFFGSQSAIYYLPGTTGWDRGLNADQLIAQPWLLPYPVLLPGSGLKTNNFVFTVSWATNSSVEVEVCTNLVNPVWLPVSTNALTWTSQFSDPGWTNSPSRFYRIRCR